MGGSLVTQVTTRIGHAIWGVATWAIFGLICLLTLVALLLVPGLFARRRLVRGSTRLIFRLAGIPLEVSGLEHLPAGHCIVVANHASYLDGMIMTAALPARFSFVIKREMTQVPGAHFFLRRIGSEFVDRGQSTQGSRDARRILQRAEGGHSLVFFPEGTFQAEPGLRRFRMGAFNAARRGPVPLVPTVIRGSRKMMPAHHWLPHPARLEVHVLPPVETKHGASSAELAVQCRAIMLPVLNEPDLES